MSNFIQIVTVICTLCVTSCNNSSIHKEADNPLISHALPRREFDLMNMTSIDYLREGNSSNNLSPDIEKSDSLLFMSIKSNSYISYNNEKNKRVNKLWLQSGNLTYSPDIKNGFFYGGYLPNSELYVFTENNISEHLNFSNLILINKYDTVLYRIISVHSDLVVKGLTESPNGEFLAYYENEGYIGDSPPCHFTVLKVNKGVGKGLLLEHKYFELEEFAIKEIRWLDNHNLLIKVNHFTEGILYYKVSV